MALIGADEEVCWVGLVWAFSRSGWGGTHGEALFGIVSYGVVDVFYCALEGFDDWYL